MIHPSYTRRSPLEEQRAAFFLKNLFCNIISCVSDEHMKRCFAEDVRSHKRSECHVKEAHRSDQSITSLCFASLSIKAKATPPAGGHMTTSSAPAPVSIHLLKELQRSPMTVSSICLCGTNLSSLTRPRLIPQPVKRKPGFQLACFWNQVTAGSEE